MNDNKLILYKKNIFNFNFTINKKNIKYCKEINLQILNIKRFFKIKKSEYNPKNFHSITKSGININHAIFIKLIKNLEIQFKDNILITYKNDINLKAFQEYFLLQNKFNLLNNIYIKDNFLEKDNNKILSIYHFNPKIKYDFIIFEFKVKKNKNIFELEYEYIEYLFHCIKLINYNLKKNGSILLLFRYFYLEQVIDYIRLISHYFKITKLYDFVITEINDLFYIYFESYNGNNIKLKNKYFYFTNEVEKEEMDKLIIIMKNRYYLHKKILYYNFINIDNDSYFKDIKYKKEIDLLKNIGYKDTDISIFTKNKYYNFLYYLKENDTMKIYNFDKNLKIPLYTDKNKIEEEINSYFIRITLPIYLIRNTKKYNLINNQRFYKHTLKFTLNKKLKVNYITRNWCKSLEMYHFIFKDNKSDIRSYHLSEYPGNFVRSLQFFCDKKFIILEDWKAQSLLNENTVNDQFKFAIKTKHHWDYGITQNGDLLSKANQKYYIKSIKNYKPNFMTADGGDFNFKKNQICLDLIQTEINIILNSLQKEGSCLIKVYLPSLELKNDIQCLYESFEKIFFLKSELNKNLPEYYIYCKNLKVRKTKITQKNDIFDNFFYIYLFKILNIFENQLNIQISMYEYYHIFVERNIKIIEKIIDEKNKIWINKYI